MAYKHGVYSIETPNGEKSFIAAQSPLIVIGAGTINQGDLNCINEPVLIQNKEDAVKAFGTTNLIEGFGINEVLHTALDIYNVTPIIAINVIDPKKHIVSKSFTGVVVVNKIATIEDIGIIPKDLVVNSGGTEVSADNYSLEFNSKGQLEIYFSDSNITSIDGTYVKLDPSLVESEDVIGKIDINTLKKEGAELIEEVFTRYSMIPGIILTPNFTHHADVRAILSAKTEGINGKWKAITIFDIPPETPYGEVISYKKNNNIIEENAILAYPKLQLGDNIYNMSTDIACQLMVQDNSNNGAPSGTASNKISRASKAVILNADGEYEVINLDETQGNLLNENGVVTAITNPYGFVLWGNRTTAFYPGGTGEKKDIWIPVRRMANFLANTLTLNTYSEVDQKLGVAKAISIRDNINNYLQSLVLENNLLGARVEFTEEKNPATNMANGVFRWFITWGDVPIAEAIELELMQSNEYLEKLF